MSELTVTVPAVPETSYRIHIGSGILSGIMDELQEHYPNLQKFVITDAGVVSAGYLSMFCGKMDVPAYVIDPPGEISKHIETVVKIIESMEKAFLGRDTLITALGGGTVGDITGFAAAVFKRGVKVVQIPTTTVAQADSSVGGKTGVDSSISKNAFGAFWQPEAVCIDVETLKTLDDVQYRAGLVESVKHALIADAGYFAFLKENMKAILDRDPAVLEEIAYKNCSIKASVVAEDPLEKNKRRILNYGHTIGHAVESVSSFELLHGQAVAIGMIGAGLIEQKMGLSGENRLEDVHKILKQLKMPVIIPGSLNKGELIDIMKRDKKAVGRWPRFVLLEEIGKALCRDGQWAHEVSKEIAEEVLDELYG